MKNNKGISLISLIITIIVIIIIASIVFYTGYNKNLNKASVVKMHNEMQEITIAVQQRAASHKLNNDAYPYAGTKLTDETAITIGGIKYGEGYYLATAEEIESILGVDNVSRAYLLNYDTGEIISKEPLYLEGKEAYTLNDIIESQLKGDLLTKTGEYDAKKNVNKPILLAGMIPVKYDSGSWIVTNENDPDWYDYSSNVGKWANVMLSDEITLIDTATGKNYTNKEVRETSLDKLQGCVVNDAGSMFVWIPRYTYKEVNGSYEIVYSKLTTDYVADGYVRNPAFYFGEYFGAETSTSPNTGYKAGGKELTGIWISKYKAGYAE